MTDLTTVLRDLSEKAGKATPGPYSVTARRATTIIDSTVYVDHDASPEAWTIWRKYRDEEDRRVHRPIGETYVVGQEHEAAAANAAYLAACPPALIQALVEVVMASREAAYPEPLAATGQILDNLRDALRRLEAVAQQLNP